MELRTEPLPPPSDWQAAVRRVQTLFGLVGNPHLTAANVAALTERVRAEAAARNAAAAVLMDRVGELGEPGGVSRGCACPGAGIDLSLGHPAAKRLLG